MITTCDKCREPVRDYRTVIVPCEEMYEQELCGSCAGLYAAERTKELAERLAEMERWRRKCDGE